MKAHPTDKADDTKILVKMFIVFLMRKDITMYRVRPGEKPERLVTDQILSLCGEFSDCLGKEGFRV